MLRGSAAIQTGPRRQVSTGGFSSKRLARVRTVLERLVDSGFVPWVVAVLARHGEVHVEATGNLAFESAGSKTPMAADTRSSPTMSSASANTKALETD